MRIRRACRRQRSGSEVRNTTRVCVRRQGRAEVRHAERVWNGRRSVGENVVEKEIVAHGKPAANHGLVLTKQTFPEVRRVREAKPRREVVVIALLTRDCVNRLIETRECGKWNRVERRAVVLVTQAERQRQIRFDSPCVFDEVILIERIRHYHWTAELNSGAARTTT